MVNRDMLDVLINIVITAYIVGLTAVVALLWVRYRNNKRKLKDLELNQSDLWRNISSGRGRKDHALTRLSEHLGGINRQLAKLEEDLSDLRRRLGVVERSMSQPEPARKYSDPDRATPSRDSRGRDRSQGALSARQVVSDYNRLINGSLPRQQFEDTYSPRSLGVVNAYERFQGADVDPKFDVMSKGRYWGIKAGGDLLVMPRPNSTIKGGDRREGGFDQLFECEERRDRVHYTVESLESPAVLSRSGPGGWQIKEAGCLTLREYS